MAKKFFNERVHNTKRTIINAIIIGVCIIGVIVCFILVSNFRGKGTEAPKTVDIKTEITTEVNEKIPKEAFFTKLENIDIESIIMKYPKNYDISTTGTYEVTITINRKKYPVQVKVIDTKVPEAEAKDVTINVGEKYSAKDFITSCVDNSNKECIIEFYTNGTDEDGNKVEYDKYTEAGTYQIKVVAKDNDENKVVKDATLTINSINPTTGETENNKPTETTCKYGSSSYDKKEYVLTVDVTSNKCAISLDLYKDNNTTQEINKIMEKETERLKKDVTALNLYGTPTLNRKVTVVLNKDATGIVGYQLQMSVSFTNNAVTTTIATYKLDSKGKRIFTENNYKLSE